MRTNQAIGMSRGLMYTMMPYMRHLGHAVRTLTRTILFTMEPPVKTRKPRKDSAYTVEERTLMNQYKQKYMTQPTRELRANVIRNEILPDLYNYWVKLGTAPQSGEESLVCMKVTLFLCSSLLPFSYIDIIVGTGGMGEKQLASGHCGE